MTGQQHDRDTLGRRRFVGAAAATTVSLAGCLGGGAGDEATAGPTDAGDETPTDGSSGEAARTTTTASDLDLREANVVDVAVEPSGESSRFAVTLYHDDDGEDGYANWWQVETLDGTRLGRRELSHPHGTTRFTRSETVEIPSGTTRVVVRGHDQTHGYGGHAMVVTLDTGETEIVAQGSEPRSFGGNGSGSTTATSGG
ncbi:hypothetical protein [Halococcus sediminicola]|uniref:hypothetical protein n=1 Tax=Halococcus sediminicola TaxID=1264579 RepID=UPI00067939CC|nr:hypothetical protein [Halococcus sediminicola]